MKFIKDAQTEESIRNMLVKLVGPEQAGDIKFGIMDYEDPDYTFGMKVWIDSSSSHLIIINSGVRDMLATEATTELVFASLAHEIGHIFDIKKVGLTGFYSLGKHLVKIPAALRKFIEPLLPHLQFWFGYWPQAECRADRYAVELLGRVYPNPVQILSRQARSARDNSMSKAISSYYTRFQARVFAWLRIRNLKRI